VDVSKLIIGADFLAFFGLLVNVRNNRLVDQITGVVAPGRCVRYDTLGAKPVTGTMIPQTTGAIPGCDKARGTSPTDKTFYPTSYQTTPPVVCRPRRLAPERLAVAKAEFQKLMDSGITRIKEQLVILTAYDAKKGRAMATLR